MASSATPEIIENINKRRKESSLSEVSELKFYSAFTKDIEAKNDGTIVSQISTILPDRDKEVLMPRGADLTEFNLSPTVLFGHEYSGTIFGTDTLSAIGKNLWTKIDDYGLVAKTKFANTDFAQQCKQLIMDDVLRMWSVGFFPIKIRPVTEEDEEENPSWKEKVWRVIEKWNMVEYSLVPIGSNPGAITLSKYADFDPKLVKFISQAQEINKLEPKENKENKIEITSKKEETKENLEENLEENSEFINYGEVDLGWNQVEDELIPESVLEQIEINAHKEISKTSKKEAWSTEDAKTFNYIIRDSEEFISLGTRTIKKDEPVVKGRYGKLIGESKSQWQSLLFPKAGVNDTGWTLSGAKDWLASNKEELQKTFKPKTLKEVVENEIKLDKLDISLNQQKEESKSKPKEITKEELLTRSQIREKVNKLLKSKNFIKKVSYSIKDEISSNTGKI
jgi:hypothetical protein